LFQKVILECSLQSSKQEREAEATPFFVWKKKDELRTSKSSGDICSVEQRGRNMQVSCFFVPVVLRLEVIEKDGTLLFLQ
jgi:hypothetical protein